MMKRLVAYAAVLASAGILSWMNISRLWSLFDGIALTTTFHGGMRRSSGEAQSAAGKGTPFTPILAASVYWNATGDDAWDVYEDKSTYYVVGKSQRARVRCSYDARKRGMSIRKSDFAVYVPSVREWVSSGLMAQTYGTGPVVRVGMRKVDVTRAFGDGAHPLTLSAWTGSAETGRHALIYFFRSSRVVAAYSNDVIIGVEQSIGGDDFRY